MNRALGKVHGSERTPVLIRAHDWSRTSLGPRETWSRALEGTIDLMLAATTPVAIFWGPDHVLLYNEGCRALLGDAHPRALGHPVEQAFAPLWDALGPALADVRQGERSIVRHGQRLRLPRHGRPHDALHDVWIDAILTPIPGDDGSTIGGVLGMLVDVTERVQAEAERRRLDPARQEELAERTRQLEQSEEARHVGEAWTAALLDGLPVGVGMVDAHGRVLSLNRVGLELHGFDSLEDMLVRFPEYLEVYELHYPDGGLMPPAQWPLARALRGDFVRDQPVLLRPPGGKQERLLSYTSVPAPPKHGEAARVIFVMHDITERTRAEDELRQALGLLHGITHGTEELIAAADGELRYIFFNDAYRREFQRLWGQELEVGTSMVEALAPWPTEQRKAVELWSRALQGESFNITTTFGPAGHEQTYALHFNPVHDAQGRRLGAAHIVRNVTQQIQVQQALQKSEERFRHLAEAVPQLVWTAREDGTVDYYNSRASNFDGLRPESEAAWSWKPVVHPHERSATVAAWQSAVASGQPYQIEHRVRMADGSFRWHLSRAYRVRGHDGRAQWFGTATDIHEVKLAQEAMREADRRKDEYLAMLGHELRNPLAAIKAAAELIELTDTDDPRLRRASVVLERQSGQMVRIIDGLLEVSRIARGKIELVEQALDLREVVDGVLEDRGAPIAARGLQLATHFPPEPLWAVVDPVRLAQVLDNLVGNAQKFTQPPGTITVVLERDGEHAVVRVRDTGVGIRPEALTRVFEPFHQEQQDVARGSGGLGLGLALAKGLVELHRGTIDARSAGLGTGAELVVRLPLASGPPEDRAMPSLVGIPPRRILIVEDNLDAAHMLRDLLEAQGHAPTVAATGAEGLELLRREHQDLVLCDIGLPGMSGYDFARAVRTDATLRDLALVALTGYGQPEDRERTAAAGFDEHLTKPVERSTLDDVLRRLAGPPSRATQ